MSHMSKCSISFSLDCSFPPKLYLFTVSFSLFPNFYVDFFASFSGSNSFHTVVQSLFAGFAS